MHLYGVETFYPLSKWGKIAVWFKDHLKFLIPENSVMVLFSRYINSGTRC